MKPWQIIFVYIIFPLSLNLDLLDGGAFSSRNQDYPVIPTEYVLKSSSSSKIFQTDKYWALPTDMMKQKKRRHRYIFQFEVCILHLQKFSIRDDYKLILEFWRNLAITEQFWKTYEQVKLDLFQILFLIPEFCHPEPLLPPYDLT